MSYTRTYTIDSSPTGDTVKSAIVDKIDVDLSSCFTDLNTHEALTATHGATGAMVGTTNVQTLTNKTINGATLSGTITCTNATMSGLTLPALNNTTLTGTTTADVLKVTTINGLTQTAATTGFTVAGGTSSCTLTVDANFVASTIVAAMPAGAVSAFAGGTAPTGWLECNGAAVSRTTYSVLFTAIGVAHGYGNNSTTFNVPDLRGYFVRGYDHGISHDPDSSTRTAAATGGATGDNVGSIQTGANVSHTHTFSATSSGRSVAHTHGVSGNTGTESATHNHNLHGGITSEGGSSFAGLAGAQYSDLTTLNESATHTHAISLTSAAETAEHTHAVSGTSSTTGGNDTRPVNISMMYIIKT